MPGSGLDPRKREFPDGNYLWNTTILGGWSVLVIYRSESIARKRIYYYTDFQMLQGTLLQMQPHGFEVPQSPSAKVTFFLGEGDLGISGADPNFQTAEGLFFNGTQLSDLCNPRDNPYNSTVNTNIRPDEQPCRDLQYSLDLDTFDIGRFIRPGDTSCTVGLSLGRDIVFTNYLIISIDTKLPDFDIPGRPEKTSSVDEAGYLVPGQEFEYGIEIVNSGEDTAYDVYLHDEIPAFTEYVPNSTTLDGAPVAEIGGRCPLATEDGLFITAAQPVGAAHSHRVTFRVRLLTEAEGVDKETKIYNVAEIRSNGSEVYVTNGGIPVRIDVRPGSYEGQAAFGPGPHNPPDGFVLPGTQKTTLLQFEVAVRAGDLLLNGATLTAGGPGDEAAGLAGIGLYEDVDNDGLVGPADLPRATGLGFSQDDGELPLSGIRRLITDGETVRFVVAADIAASAAAGDGFQVHLTGVDILGRPPTGLPVGGPLLSIPGGDIAIGAGPNGPSEGSVAAGSSVTALQIRLASFSGPHLLTGLRLAQTGTLRGGIGQVRLIADGNGNGLRDPGEAVAGSAAVDSSGAAAFEGLSLAVSATPVFVLVETDIEFGAMRDRYVQFGFEDDGDATFDAALQVEGAPFYGPKLFIADQIDGDSPVDGDSAADGDFVSDGDTGSGQSSSGGCGAGRPGVALGLLFGLLGLRRRRWSSDPRPPSAG